MGTLRTSQPTLIQTGSKRLLTRAAAELHRRHGKFLHQNAAGIFSAGSGGQTHLLDSSFASNSESSWLPARLPSKQATLCLTNKLCLRVVWRRTASAKGQNPRLAGELHTVEVPLKFACSTIDVSESEQPTFLTFAKTLRQCAARHGANFRGRRFCSWWRNLPHTSQAKHSH